MGDGGPRVVWSAGCRFAEGLHRARRIGSGGFWGLGFGVWALSQSRETPDDLPGVSEQRAPRTTSVRQAWKPGSLEALKPSKPVNTPGSTSNAPPV